MIQLKENAGISVGILTAMAVIAGFTVANCYYNQPLLELIRADLHVSEAQANLITVITQIGYALGLFFIIPMGDLYSRRRIVMVNMLVAALMAVVIATAGHIAVVWGASLIIGACSVVPQIFIPIAGQFSESANKSRNIGIVLSGLLTGILASRVVSGYVGNWLGWRPMFFIAAVLMVVCMGVTLMVLPDMKRNFEGSYAALMKSLWQIVCGHPRIRLNAARAGFAFGSMLAIWSCMAFHLAQPPFSAGSDKVGMLGLCGVAGALAASRIGKYVHRFGVHRFSLCGGCLQILAWMVAYVFRDSYVGLISAVVIVDVGTQCLQLSNQSACIQELPQASNRANTLLMTTYFIGGSLGTFCAGIAWERGAWPAVCLVGVAFPAVSLALTLIGGWRRRA